MKRILDILISFVGIIAFFPLILLVGLVVRVTLGSPVLFRQVRAGKNGRLFTLNKFRTMTDARDLGGELLPDPDRLFSVGVFLRKTSFDELPQLYNVIKGDMSLVGPRPLLPEYLPLYSKHHARRHEVRPGITGWAQVNGRQMVTYSQKFDLDVYYVDNKSICMDLRILWMTFARVLSSKDIKPGQTVEEVDDLGFWNEIKKKSE